MCNKIDLIITYVISQLTFRWVEPPDFSEIENDNIDDKFLNWTAKEWQQYIDSRYRNNPRWQFCWDLYVNKFFNSSKLLADELRFHMESLDDFNASIITWDDPHYPELLRTIKDPPICLNVVGDISFLNYPKISIIGSRRACPRSIRESRELGFSLAKMGVAVVSGGAYGCDIAAHKGVLASGLSSAPAIVVFAGGLGEYYPSGNLSVFRSLRDRNALFVSERLWSYKPHPYDFPIRNRIVSGLSPETVVMHAARKSGAMVTARLALDQGRDVSVLHFDDDDIATSGSIGLKRDGARTFKNANDWFDNGSEEFQFFI